MPEYRLRQNDQKYLVFSGELLADVSDRFRYGQEQESWTEIRVYRTATGTYVMEEVARTLWQKGEGVRYKAEVYSTPQEVYAALVGSEANAGLGDLEKELLTQLVTQDLSFARMAERQQR
jgi:hypothetical protein